MVDSRVWTATSLQSLWFHFHFVYPEPDSSPPAPLTVTVHRSETSIQCAAPPPKFPLTCAPVYLQCLGVLASLCVHVPACLAAEPSWQIALQIVGDSRLPAGGDWRKPQFYVLLQHLGDTRVKTNVEMGTTRELNHSARLNWAVESDIKDAWSLLKQEA